MPPSAKRETVDAITLLKGDHRTVEELFKRFESTNAKATKTEDCSAGLHGAHCPRND